MSGQHRYVALIRAVNVGLTNPMKMSDLRELFESLGFRDVRTYIQTGNVVFSSEDGDPGRVTRRIEDRLEAETRHPAKVFLRTADELREAAAQNPFEPARHDAEQRCHLMFLSAAPNASSIDALMALRGEVYRFSVRGRVLYYAYDRKYDGNRRTIDFEKVLGVSGTSRSWKVVEALVELADAGQGRRDFNG